tara:strand:+ start:229 stop:948 length:720 start_codon:yes stop_codon:yes gene_type:complete
MEPNEIFEKLSAPFAPDQIHWRIGSTTKDKAKGMALAYIDSRDVMDRLDEVLGPQNWQSRYPHVGTKTCCEIGIKVDSEWVWKSDGAGDTDVEGDKGAFSDSLKRAAVQFGIGRYLYGLGATWVEIEPAGRSFKIKQNQYVVLKASLSGAASPPAKEHRGPIGISELRRLSQEICTELKSCTDMDMLVAYWMSDAISEPLKQMQHDHPDGFNACVEHKEMMKINLTDTAERAAIEGENA